MTDRIADILQIVPATDWYFEDEGQPKKKLSDFVPVALFAMVTFANDALNPPSDVIMKRTLPLDRHSYSDLEWLVGKAVEDFDIRIIHRSQIEALINGDEIADEGDNLMASKPFGEFAESRRAG
jgi:hypothetical protein